MAKRKTDITEKSLRARIDLLCTQLSRGVTRVDKELKALTQETGRLLTLGKLLAEAHKGYAEFRKVAD